jgi:hypothetical protein
MFAVDAAAHASAAREIIAREGEGFCFTKRRHRGATHEETYFGERNGRHKLTEEQVRELRSRHATGEGLVELARHFGIARQNAGGIVARRYWRHVA